MPRESSSGQVSDWGKTKLQQITATNGLPGVITIAGLSLATIGATGNIRSCGFFYLDAPARITAMRMEVTGAGSASSVMKIGIYQTTASYALANARYAADSGNISVSSSGSKEVTGLTIDLNAGFFICVMDTDSSTNVQLRNRFGSPVTGVVNDTFANFSGFAYGNIEQQAVSNTFANGFPATITGSVSISSGVSGNRMCVGFDWNYR